MMGYLPNVLEAICQKLLQRFIEVCWHTPVAHYAAGLYPLHLTLSDNISFLVVMSVVVA